MQFVQTIHVKTDDVSALEDLAAGWHETQSGLAPGYQGSRILADRDRPGEYLMVVDFTSAEEAAKNNDREATAEWASKLAVLATEEAEFANYDQVFSVG